MGGNIVALCPPHLVRCRRLRWDKLTGAFLMPFNVADLPWQAIGLLTGLAFVTSLIGHSLTRSAIVGAIITAILFAAIYIAWDYYPHHYLEGVRFPNTYVK
jgi:hypothetical protein